VTDCIYIGKRRRSAEDEDATEHTRKSPRIQESCHNPEGKVQSPPSRTSPRLQKIHDLKNQQRIARAGKQTRLSLKTSKVYHCVEQEQPQAKRGFLRSARKCWLDYVEDVVVTMLASAVEQRRVSEDKDKKKPKSSLTNQKAQKSGLSPLSLSVTDNVTNLSSQTATKHRERWHIEPRRETSSTSRHTGAGEAKARNAVRTNSSRVG
jgi:hypothetical protein